MGSFSINGKQVLPEAASFEYEVWWHDGKGRQEFIGRFPVERLSAAEQLARRTTQLRDGFSQFAEIKRAQRVRVVWPTG